MENSSKVTSKCLFGPRNVGDIERVASGGAGAVLVTLGMRAKSLPGSLLALLGGALIYRALSGNCKCYEALAINTAEGPHDRVSVPGNRGIKVERTVMVYRPAAELFRTWRNFENLPNFMGHVRKVKSLGENRSHWEVSAPGGQTVEWDAEIINEHPDEMISWRSLEGADVYNAGTVRFRPLDGGTEVRVTLEYDPPGGKLGAAFARLFGEEPGQQISEDLLRFKHLMETSG